MKNNQSQIKEKRPTKGRNAQRKSGKRLTLSLPRSATRRRLNKAAADQEREELMKEKLLFIERNGSAEFRLYLSNVLTALAKMVGSAMAPASATGSDNIAAEHELFLIGEVIRQSRAMDARRGLSYLRYFAQLLPASRPARSALFRAVKASKRQRSVLLDLIQLGGYCCATTL